ncbi:substrate-binding periplasmic protein [Aquipseudomonas ullengensis]|uniref:Transporter substrate-binding domain-containing protein n=1 Tax=Aquipseudomonas ullengensis TaxID=2759166 RepID=A0A7W4LKL0_9GAMM|nr:transporter substrate-binding domain-containing protein [Pseudomonas ullengensis]MBB2494877.1 transporter substrate-binding domain-containing protein [Pseudomonas ullengensis]
MTRIEGNTVKGLLKTLGALCLCWFMHSAHADTFEVGFYDYPPMMIEDGRRGIYQDIFDALATLTGDHFNVQYYPYPRIGLLFNEGKLDIEPGVYPGWVRDQSTPGVFSVPFGKVVDVLVFAPHKAFAVKQPEDLRGKSVGMVRGYAYPELATLVASGQLDRRNGLNEQQLLSMLAKSRFDQIIVNKAIAQYHRREVPEYRQLEIGDVISSYDVSMRVHPAHAAWLNKLDAAIVQLKQQGTIEKIYAAYGVHL